MIADLTQKSIFTRIKCKILMSFLSLRILF